MTIQPVNEAYKEILRLDKMLTDAGIPHNIDREEDGWRIVYPSHGARNIVCSVIEYTGSNGARMDRMEITGLLNHEERKAVTVIGWLTAENVFDRLKRDWERRKARHEKVESRKAGV